MNRFVFVLLVLVAGSVPVVAPAQPTSYPRDCVQNVDNATVLLPSDADASLSNGETLAPGDTVALRTPDGTCAGYGVQPDGDAPLILSAAGPAPIDEATGGYSTDDRLSFEVYDTSAEDTVDLGSTVTYAACDTLAVTPCADDGAYADGTVFVLDALGGGGSLPVEFAGISVRQTAESVVVQWTTASETNNAGFEVQHRPATRPDEAWTSVQFVEGKGTTTRASQYRVSLETPDVGSHQYRLRQIDQDGTEDYSRVVDLDVKLRSAYQISEVAPNPVQGRAVVSVAVQTAQPVTIAVYNVMGQRVATLHDRRLPANQERDVPIRADQWASGSYFLRVRGESFAATRRLTVVH